MGTRYHLYKGLLPILALASLLSACSPAITWDYPRTPSNTFRTSGRPPPSARCFRKRPTNIRDYPASLLFGKVVRRSWLGWRWPT